MCCTQHSLQLHRRGFDVSTTAAQPDLGLLVGAEDVLVVVAAAAAAAVDIAVSTIGCYARTNAAAFLVAWCGAVGSPSPWGLGLWVAPTEGSSIATTP